MTAGLRLQLFSSLYISNPGYQRSKVARIRVFTQVYAVSMHLLLTCAVLRRISFSSVFYHFSAYLMCTYS